MNILNNSFWIDPNHLDPQLLEEEFHALRKEHGVFHGLKELRRKYNINDKQFKEQVMPLVRKDVRTTEEGRGGRVMSICNLIFGGITVAAAIKLFAELVRKGNATDAVWSTLQSVGEVTSKMATFTAISGDSVASYAKKKVPQDQTEQGEANHVNN